MRIRTRSFRAQLHSATTPYIEGMEYLKSLKVKAQKF
jgi:hypothetical protein